MDTVYAVESYDSTESDYFGDPITSIVSLHRSKENAERKMRRLNQNAQNEEENTLRYLVKEMQVEP